MGRGYRQFEIARPSAACATPLWSNAPMGTIVITGSASGIGAATRRRLETEGHRVIGVDLHNAEVIADLSTVAGRASMVDDVAQLSGGVLDGLLAGAGISGRTNESGRVLKINYFGAVATLIGLRPLLARGTNASAVAISSNAATTQPGGADPTVVELCLEGREDEAVAIMTGVPAAGYAIAKLALARWVRRRAVTDEWVGAGIRLNAIAPGIIVTPMTEAGLSSLFAMPDWPRPTKEPGRPEEVAGFVRYLLSTEARYFVGSFLVMDGGTEAALRSDDWPTAR
jgi:NAD(P)-dependent dehydrogenase (short-subunit alcohol dehydrogenase family)